MSSYNMLVIKDDTGTIIGAHVEDQGGDVRMSIAPADPKHTMHRIEDVPAEIVEATSAPAFQKAIADHISSGKAKISETTAEEASRRLFS